jgi:hypothetical protein
VKQVTIYELCVRESWTIYNASAQHKHESVIIA